MAKRPTLKKYGNCKSGYYDVSESKKYIFPDGVIEPPQYKSSYEWLFMRFAERNNKVITWSSEPFPIPYFDMGTQKNRNYWIDFTLKTASGEIWWVEVKDSKEVEEVNRFKRKFESIQNPNIAKQFALKNPKVAMNYCKWVVAKQFAISKGAVFHVVTEKDLKGYI